jgi:hypothetical protein
MLRKQRANSLTLRFQQILLLTINDYPAAFVEIVQWLVGCVNCSSSGNFFAG